MRQTGSPVLYNAAGHLSHGSSQNGHKALHNGGSKGLQLLWAALNGQLTCSRVMIVSQQKSEQVDGWVCGWVSGGEVQASMSIITSIRYVKHMHCNAYSWLT